MGTKLDSSKKRESSSIFPSSKVPLVFRGTFSSPEQLQKSLEKWKAEKSAVGADVEAEGEPPRKKRFRLKAVSLKRHALFPGIHFSGSMLIFGQE